MTKSKRKPRYEKECCNCGRTFRSNYERSTPCAQCGSWNVRIVADLEASTIQPIPQQVSPAKPTIKREVTEEWKGIVYKKDSINGNTAESHVRNMEGLIRQRDNLNDRIRKMRYQTAWHKKRLEKGYFE